jgi:hypothetical protein
MLECGRGSEVKGMNTSTRPVAVVLAIFLLLPACAAATHDASWDENGLHYFFATTKDTFTMYEYVPIQYTVTNASQDTLIIEHPCAGLGGTDFAVWAPGTPFHPDPILVWGCCGCLDEDWFDYSFEPGESYDRRLTWDMYDMYKETLITRPGTYRIDGTFRAYLWPGHISLRHSFSLYVEILGGAASISEETGTWSTIKALYR